MTSNTLVVPWRRSLAAPRMNLYIHDYAMNHDWDLQHFSRQEREGSRVSDMVYATPDGLAIATIDLRMLTYLKDPLA